MPIEDRNLKTGQRLEARYKGETYRATAKRTESGALVIILDDNPTPFASPSAAGSAVMGGIACNGWRFWSVEGEGPKPRRRKAKDEPAGPRMVQQITRMENGETTPGHVRWFCSACQDVFERKEGEEPKRCTKGHHAEVRDEFAATA